jgi:hypothetical protein
MTAPRVDSEEKLRQEAIQELVESERAYTNDMAVVRQVNNNFFLIFLSSLRVLFIYFFFQVFEKPLSRSGFVTREQMGKIFLNWREILRQNHSLLKLFDERKKQSPNGVIMCIGDILRDNVSSSKKNIWFSSFLFRIGLD